MTQFMQINEINHLSKALIYFAAIAAGIWMQHKKRSTSISIIGGADGPTSIYIAGKIDGTSLLIPGILLLAAGIVAAVLLRKK